MFPIRKIYFFKMFPERKMLFMPFFDMCKQYFIFLHFSHFFTFVLNFVYACV